MAFLRNLEERFNEKMDELYSARFHPEKDSGELHPLLYVRPNDPNRPQGTGQANRLVPIQRVLTDQRRFLKFFTNPQGLQFLLEQQLLQTGNTFSETRVLNPLFVNLNLAPHEHFKRALRDQTEVRLADPERSPASTPEVGVAGRLQRETADRAILGITNRPAARSAILGLLGRTQIGQTVLGTIGIGANIGTLGVNQRPEFSVADTYYSILLHRGYQPFAVRELGLVMGALNAAGTALSVVGIPNIFRGVDDFVGGANPIPAQTTQMRYFITDNENAFRYINDSSGIVRRPTVFTSTFSRLEASARGANLLGELASGAPRISLLGRSLDTDLRNAAPMATDKLISAVNEPRNDQQSTISKMGHPEDSLEVRYDSDKRLDFVANALQEQSDLIRRYTDNIGSDLLPSRGVLGGITLEQLKALNAIGATETTDERQIQSYFQTLPKREIGVADSRTAPGYYHDTLNLITRLEGPDLPREIDGQQIPQDYINVLIYNKADAGGRLEPFRALLSGITETISTEWGDNKYIGRIERNIVFLGATRQLNFTLKLHAWSPRELQRVWDKVNFVTGLAFPSAISGGFLLPPIVELTIGDFYKAQPGYFVSVTHTIEDDISWEIEPGAQVPHGITMQIAFAVIERQSMTASSPFYGFGVPVT